MSRRQNRLRFKSRISYRGVSADGTTMFFTKNAHTALEHCLKRPTDLAHLEVVSRSGRIGFVLDVSELPSTNQQLGEIILPYRETLRGVALMQQEGASVFMAWASEQYLLGRKPRRPKTWGALVGGLNDLHAMHRRAQRAEAALARLTRQSSTSSPQTES